MPLVPEIPATWMLSCHAAQESMVVSMQHQTPALQACNPGADEPCCAVRRFVFLQSQASVMGKGVSLW